MVAEDAAGAAAGRPATAELEALMTLHRRSHPDAPAGQLTRAFDTAANLHAVTHALAVAGVLAELGMDTTTLVAALLRDTVGDTAYTVDQLRADFGDEVATLAGGVTALGRVKLGRTADAETARKMIVAMARDPRVLVVTLADRLHTMRTVTFLPRPEQERTARETLEILAPLAQRLGLDAIWAELVDLAFGTLFPAEFHEINRLLDEHAPQRHALLQQLIQKAADDLGNAAIRARVTGRLKPVYSIHRKMTSRNRRFTEIYDLLGVRILVDTVRDCYAAHDVIRDNWPPVPGRFKDYIAAPKGNVYQSLHTTVTAPDGTPVEIQIRTTAMHRTAEHGAASQPPAHIDEMTWLRQLLDWQRQASDPGEFLDALRFDLSSQTVYVLTPHGDVLALPTGSTPVDFAYAVHTAVGHTCLGARINGIPVPLESTLSNGDVVEIDTSDSPNAGPSPDWLGFVTSGRARTKIRRYLNRTQNEPGADLHPHRRTD